MFPIYAKRLKEARQKANNMTQLQVQKATGINNKTLSGYETGKNQPDYDTLKTLCDLYGVSTDWVLGHTNTPHQLTSTEKSLLPVEFVQIPIYGEIRAGYGSLAQEDIIGYEVTSRESVGDGEYFYLVVKGDSMIDEGIYEGMRVLVRKQNHCQHGKIGVVIVDGEEGTLKRVYYEDDTVVLRASNRRIPPRPYPLEEVIIQGQVTKVEFDV